MHKEIIGDCTLYLGDCMEIIPTLGMVDAVVTDPPYGINILKSRSSSYGKKNGKCQVLNKIYNIYDWDDKGLTKEQFELLQKISKQQIIFGGNYFPLPPSSCWLVWDKQNGTTHFADCELAWTNLNKPVRLIQWQWNGFIRKNCEPRYSHPTQKPLGVMQWCLSHVPDAGLILDPYMGSGTTGVACLKERRKFIGIEMVPEYFETACERLYEQLKIQQLF
jgi:DNA modification methylase